MSKQKAPATLTLQVICRDGPGIVAQLANLVWEHGGNLLDVDSHADSAAGVFFSRLQVTREGFGLSAEELAAQTRERLQERQPEVSVQSGERAKRVALLVSKVDHCLYDLLLRQRSGELRCEIPLVISNHERLQPVAEHFGVPFHHFPVTKETKPQQEGQVLALMRESQIDVVVLARYMQILSADFVAEYPNRIVNIHHSFLPAFQGARPYHRAHTRGVKVIGATGHYVTAGLDEGPIIAQDVVRVSHRDSVQDLKTKGRDLEKVVLARALKAHLEDRVLVYANKTVVFA